MSAETDFEKKGKEAVWERIRGTPSYQVASAIVIASGLDPFVCLSLGQRQTTHYNLSFKSMKFIANQR